MTEQEKFEHWVANSHVLNKSTSPDDCGEYTHPWAIGAWQGWQAAIASREPLYHATSKLMAHLGAFGEITTRSPLADDVMDALHDIDGGVYQPPKD